MNAATTTTVTRTPKFEMLKKTINGRTAIEIIVRNADVNPELYAECKRLGLEPTVDIANRRSIHVFDAASGDAIRQPLLKFFA